MIGKQHVGRGQKSGKGQKQGRGGAPERPWYAPPQTRGEAVKQSYLETRPEYLPLKRQLHQEAAASDRRTKETGGWWNEYLKTVQNNQAATSQAYADAASQQQGMIGQASAVDSSNTARLNSEASASAASRGMTAPTDQFTGRANAAQAQRNYLSAAQGGATAARGANQYAYLGEKGRVGAGQRVKSMMDERARGRGIKEDLLAAKKEQGAQASKNFSAKADRYREEALKRQAFGLEKQQAGTEAAESQFQRKLDVEKNQRERESQHNENQEQRNQNRKAQNEGKGKGGRTQSEIQDTREGRHNAYVTAKNLYKAAKKPPQSDAQWAAFTQLIAAEEEISPTEAQWAVKKFRHQVEGRGVNTGEDVNGASLGR